MTATTWDPSTNHGEKLSNGNLTATDPGNAGLISVEGTTAIHSGQKVYMEYTVSGGATGTALGVGFATKPWDGIGDANDPGNPAIYGLGNHNVNPYPTHAAMVNTAYDGSINIGGYFVLEPHRGVNQWPNGGTVQIAIDTGANRFWERDSSTNNWNNDPNANPSTGVGGIDISSMAGETLYPWVAGWIVGGGTATINGGAAGFKDAVPTGFTGLDMLGGTAPTPTNTITVNEPASLAVGTQIITGHETDPTQAVYLDWRTHGTPNASDGDAVKATVDSQGNFTAQVTIDQANLASTMYAGTSGALTAQWSATPIAFIEVTSGTPNNDQVTITQPTTLTTGLQVIITGMETDPTQSVFLEWRTSGTPALNAADWVQATVSPNGQFSAAMNIDHAGTQSTMFYQIGSGPVVAAWSATPTM